MVRLVEQLLTEGKKDKAKKIIDLCLAKMPIDNFGYYTAVEPLAKGYYEVNEPAKARKVLDQLIKKYVENLKYYSTMRAAEQRSLGSEIITDIERYRSLLLVMKESNDMEYYNKCKGTFNTLNKTFDYFHRDAE